MAFRAGGGGRRFNNRFSNNRGSGFSGGPPQRQGGFQFAGTQNPSQNSFRSRVNKPRLCLAFQSGACPNSACQDLHQYSYHGEIGRLQQIMTNSPVFAATLIQNSQISVALTGRVAIFDIKTGQCVAEFPIQGRTRTLNYSEEYGQGFIFYGGDSGQRQLLGAISTAGANLAFAPVHSAGINSILIRRGLIFAGGDDCKVSVWYLNNQSFEFGLSMEMDPAVQSPIQCSELVKNMFFAGLSSGIIVAWEYNFDSNQYNWVGKLQLYHTGKVSSLTTLNDSYLFSGGEDGIVNCWDSNTNYQGGPLLNATKAKPVQISQLLLCEANNTICLLIGTTQGKILWYSLQGSEAKFMQPLSYHRKCVTGLLKFEGLEGYSGFLSTSIDPVIHVSNWNVA